MKLTPAMEQFVLHWGEMGTRWGVNRSVAQIHALLFLSERALNAEEIAETLAIARSNVSTSLKELMSWNLVQLVHLKGDRRDHFEAEHDCWVMLRRIAEGRKQREIERITRILRSFFDPSQVQAPEPSQIKRIILIGPYARRSWYEDGRTIYFSAYEFWIVVNHPLFTDERCWQRARDVIRSELGYRCAVDLEFYSKADIRVAKAERDTFILDRIEAGICLYRASRDAPLNARERGEVRP